MPRKTAEQLPLEICLDVASMRPRPDAAENAGAVPFPGQLAGCRFNEAAARCRGKRAPRRRAATARPKGFNEAAARCRGKRGGFSNRRWDDAVAASMRPRPDAAENSAERVRLPGALGGFNEAAARCRGKPGVIGRLAQITRALQ